MSDTTSPAAGDTPAPEEPSGSRELAEQMPSWLGSIRFRLTAIYSLLLFGLAAVVVGGLYAGLVRELDEEPVSRTFVVQQPIMTEDGLTLRRDTVLAEFQSLEQLVNERAIEQLRNYSFLALGVLFLASLGVGWIVAGRVLAPIGQITAVARDITATDLTRRIALGGPNDELRDLADTFDDMLDRLQSAFESQRRLVQDASHELRNPLAVMRTNLDVVLADPDATVDDFRRAAVIVNRSADRMSGLVEGLLSSARRGLPASAWEPVYLAEVVAETAEEFALPAEERSLRIERATDSETAVLGDRNALRQAVANLVGNAVRLAPAGSRIQVAAGANGEWAYISVADEGPGIPEADQRSVFERGWQGEGHGGASGLGLTIVREIIERHGGHVDLASAEGEGSTFVLWLPPY